MNAAIMNAKSNKHRLSWAKCIGAELFVCWCNVCGCYAGNKAVGLTERCEGKAPTIIRRRRLRPGCEDHDVVAMVAAVARSRSGPPKWAHDPTGLGAGFKTISGAAPWQRRGQLVHRQLRASSWGYKRVRLLFRGYSLHI